MSSCSDTSGYGDEGKEDEQGEEEEQTAEEVVEAGDDLWDLLAEYTIMC